MIDQVDQALASWVQKTLNIGNVVIAAPQNADAGTGVGLFLLESVPTPRPRAVRRPPLQIMLRYLVTTWAETAVEAHRMLGELLFAALAEDSYEIESEAPPLTLWTALSVTPRPSFLLRTPIHRERPERTAPLVRAPLVVNAGPLERLGGVVLGPGDIPVMNARVELPTLQLSTQTDADGRFQFAGVPPQTRANGMRIRARGKEYSLTGEPAADRTPLVIRLQLPEE